MNEYKTTLKEANEASRNGTFRQTYFKHVATGAHTMMKIANFNDLPSKDYIVERLEISPGNLVLLCATGCSGKTMFIQYLATCISTNTPLFGKFQVTQGSIVHIDQEQSEIQTIRRYTRLANGIEAKTIDVMRVPLDYRFDDPTLNIKDVEQELIDLCTGKILCIIDSLKAVSYADENSANIEVILKMFKKVAGITKCAILCVHHKGKGKDAKQSGRGHSSIYDSCDVQFDLECHSEVYQIECAKNREGKYFDGLKYTLLDTGPFSASQNCTERLEFSLLQDDVKPKMSQRDKVIEELTKTDQLKYNDLFTAVRGDRSKFGDVLEAMVMNKEIVETKGPKNSKLYSLTEDFKQVQAYK